MMPATDVQCDSGSLCIPMWPPVTCLCRICRLFKCIYRGVVLLLHVHRHRGAKPGPRARLRIQLHSAIGAGQGEQPRVFCEF